jgi:endonuclease G, mitochondrial
VSTFFEQALKEQQEAAAARVKARVRERQSAISLLRRPGGIASVNPPKDVARRFDRLTRYYAGEHLPTSPSHTSLADAGDVVATAVERMTASLGGDAALLAEAYTSVTTAAVTATPPTGAAAPTPEEQAGLVLEKIINSNDLLGIRYLEAGVVAARAVCRVNICDRQDHVAEYGTASLVSPRLLLTNHHVLPSADVARISCAEFNYQDGVDGQPLQSLVLRLDPDSFFVTDKGLDFALVSIVAEESVLQPFGFNRLIEAQGKAVIGEFVTIIQHPGGQRKQVALRENKIVDELELFLHYETDTEPGSSGSPVFNDQWEIVALHHASVPTPGKKEYGGYLNEGIRASCLLHFLHGKSYSASAQRLVDQLYVGERLQVCSTTVPEAAPLAQPAKAASEPREWPATSPSVFADAGAVFLSVPLEIAVRLGHASAEPVVGAQPPALAATDSVCQEGISIDPDYRTRQGYEEDFLGEGEARVPLPVLSDDLRAKAAMLATEDAADTVLRYHHFSVVMNEERRLAFFTAVNIDGRTSVRLKRDPDRWSYDPRIPQQAQTGDSVYTNNPLDRGHLVRRLDPAWGPSPADAKRAADDTYHFTNCSPQHKEFNENRRFWPGLEDYLLDNAENYGFRASVFSGPVFADDDDEYRGVRLPRQFWKVAVMLKTGNQLSATAYLLSQESLISGIEKAAAFSYGAYSTYQVPVQRIEDLTGISFGDLKSADPLSRIESTRSQREITTLDDIIL